jgi:Raf kinase inhibitor-like YbhB/YbcL family protein
MAFSITSQWFKNGENIPPRFTPDAYNVSPALEWEDLPPHTESLALVVHDPDAPRQGGFTHWVIFNIPPSPNYLVEGILSREHLRDGAVQGCNSAGANGYMGPAPPPGAPHHYHFTLYALDRRMNLPPTTDREGLLEAMEGHVLAATELVGLYQK